jgi:hypothetical protein
MGCRRDSGLIPAGVGPDLVPLEYAGNRAEHQGAEEEPTQQPEGIADIHLPDHLAIVTRFFTPDPGGQPRGSAYDHRHGLVEFLRWHWRQGRTSNPAIQYGTAGCESVYLLAFVR